jgi:ribulose 1,5-bisphosphate synthetase/thiazole synthase
VGYWQARSLWLSRHHCVPGPRLDGDQAADVVIVGAALTGLWSAIHLKEADAAIEIVVLEREIAGYGGTAATADS